jgi:hypothetical protein
MRHTSQPQAPRPEEVTLKHFENPDVGISFDYPSDVVLGNMKESSSTLYAEFCGPVSCGMAATEFLLVKRSKATSIEGSHFDYSSGWREVYRLPTAISSASTQATIGPNKWYIEEVRYSDGGTLFWHQILGNQTLVSFVLDPQASYAAPILKSFRFVQR